MEGCHRTRDYLVESSTAVLIPTQQSSAQGNGVAVGVSRWRLHSSVAMLSTCCCVLVLRPPLMIEATVAVRVRVRVRVRGAAAR